MSSVVDEDTAQAIESGRERVGGILSEAQGELRKAFLAFTFSFLATVLALRWYLWEYLEANTTSRMAEEVAADTDIIARTPFDVILMQIKIGLIIGVIVGIVALLYLVRTKIIARVEEADAVEVTVPRLYGFVALSAGLAVAGLSYAYGVFFPLMFMVLAEQAHQAGVKPSYGIVRYTEFLLLLTISFALAAQLPLFMGALSYAEVVPYETFRDKWRYAILGIFVFGAIFSPPDPFTQILWAIPLITLYAFSLGIAKVVTNVRRAGATGSPIEPGTFKRRGYAVAAAFFLGTVAAAGAFAAGAETWLNEHVLPVLPETVSIPMFTEIGLPTAIETAGPVDWLLAGVQVGIVVGGIALLYVLVWILRQPVVPRTYAVGSHDPSEMDLRHLDAGGVKAAPPEAFESVDAGLVLEAAEAAYGGEDEAGADADADADEEAAAWGEAVLDRYLETVDEDAATEVAGTAIEAGDKDVGRSILERFYEIDQQREEASDEDEPGAAEGAAAGGAGGAAAAEAAGGDDGGDPLTSTAAGMMDAFTEENTDEDDIGGYLYDIRFILDSLRSRLFVLFGLFLGTFGAMFGYLYWRGIEDIMRLFTAQVPTEEFAPGRRVTDATDIVIALHPVEVLIFIVKFSGIVSILVTLPVLLYYAWPAVQQRGFVPGGGDRRGFLLWGGTILLTTTVGAAVGFLFVAPQVVSWLVTDAAASGMVISYRVRSLLWVVFFLTIGIGLFGNVPVGMALVHYADLISFERMFHGWRHVTFGIFVFSWLFSPRGVLTMLLLAVPAAIAYLLGLAILWALTLPSRMLAKRQDPQAG